ncbi:MAG: DUF4870 domain-containing protein [Planctomycetota bacterium]
MEENIESPQPPETPDTGAQAKQPESAQPPEAPAEVSKDARMWAMFCHLAGLALFILPGIGNVVGPLIFWQIKKDEFAFVDNQGKEAVNFQISMSIYGAVAGLLCFACVGVFLLPAVVVVDLVFLLIAAVKANNGESYRYPLCIRFIK